MAVKPAFATIDTDDFLAGSMPSGKFHVEDPGVGRSSRKRNKIQMYPSEWVSEFVRIKDGNTGKVAQINFEEREYLKRPYNAPQRRILLMTSRQTEKSTTIGNKLMALCNMRPMYEALFVTPAAIQTTGFSKARIDGIVDISPMLKQQRSRHDTWNLLEKTWMNRSKIYLRYAFLNADRIRGLSVNAVFGDEIQDLLQDVMPVIEETASHHQGSLFVYSGTPKTFDNTIENYWSKHSTQNEWCIPCEHHGTPKDPSSWHWIVLGPKNIGKTGPVCERCGNAINPQHPYARWVQMNPGADWEGFRICRLMVPWFQGEKWHEILEAQRRYPMAQFMNEVMALSYDSGVKPLTRGEVVRVCDDSYTMDEDQVAKLRESHKLYAGIDWGTGENAYTVMFVGGYTRSDNHFQIVYARRFDGPLVDPDPQMAEIFRLINKFRIGLIGTDYGMGFHPNKKLISAYGAKRIHPFQYVARTTHKVKYAPARHVYVTFRTPVMADIFNAIKATKIRFPRWDRFREPFAEDMLSIRSEYSETQKMIKYDKTRGVTDDSFHALVYTVLASMFEIRRPDIIAPIQESTEEGARSREEDWVMENTIDMAPMIVSDDPYSSY